jgi:hypothetical protein
VIRGSLTRKIVTTDTGGTFLHRLWINAFSFEKEWMDSSHFELISIMSRGRRASPNTKRPPVREGVGTSVPASSYLTGASFKTVPPCEPELSCLATGFRFFFCKRESQPTRSLGRAPSLSGVHWVYRACTGSFGIARIQATLITKLSR